MSKIKVFILKSSPIALILIWILSLVIFAWFINSPAANGFWINIAASLFFTLFITMIALTIVAFKNLPDRLKIYDLLQTTEDGTILIFVSKIVLPSGNGYTFNGRLRFGGLVIALQEYFAAYELKGFLEQDILASYPTNLRAIISKIPTIKPLKSVLQVSPWDEYTLKRECHSMKAVSIVSLGSPGSNWVTAYVSEYHPGWFKFGTDGDYVKVARGPNNSTYSLDKYKDIGIIQRVKLPNENMTITILAGLTDFSTKMCATYFVKNWRKIAEKYKYGVDFGICLGIPLDDDQAKIISAYPERS